MEDHCDATIESQSQPKRNFNTEHASPGSTFNILDLDDDCLREICDYLDLNALCSFADVCSRFKQNAQAKFRSMKMRDITKDAWIELPDITKYRMLRNFGPSITSLVAVALKRNNEYLVLMIIRHCGEALKSLTLQSFRINAYLGERLLSLITRLEKFGIIECHCQPSFCEKLPFNSPNLRELEFKFEYYSQYSNVFVLGGLPHTFPKLETFSMVDLENRDLKAFLIKNRQIKTIHMESANGNEENFLLIAEHLPTLEHVGIVVSKRWNMENHSNLRKMSALKSLLLKSHRSSNVAHILKKMVMENVPIENLELIKCPRNNDLLTVIPKFQKLKVLRLIDVEDITIADIVKMCKELEELTELTYRTGSSCTPPDLLALVRSAKNLRKLHFQSKHWAVQVNADTFIKIVDVIKRRGDDTKPMEIILMGKPHTIDVSKEMMNANKHLLTIEIKKVWEEIDFGFPVQDDIDYEFNFELDFLHSFASRTRRRRL